MNRVTPYVIAAIFAGALAASILAQRSTAAEYGANASRGAAPAPVATVVYPTRWEYGRFRYTPNQTDWSWRSGGERITGDAITLYRKLEGPQRPVSNDIWYGEVVSALGQQGWEVQMMRDYEGGSEVWFKRPGR